MNGLMPQSQGREKGKKKSVRKSETSEGRGSGVEGEIPRPLTLIRSTLFLLFDRLDLFRISDFGFLILFVLGALCAFARVIPFRLPEISHLITLSALASTFGGIVRPICLAVA